MDAILNRRANRLASLSLLMLLAASVWAQTPTSAENSVGSSLSNITGAVSMTYATYVLSLPNVAGAGNAIAMTVRDASGNGSSYTITDNCASGCGGANTYTQEKCESDSNTNRVCEFLALNVSAGTHLITINASPSDDYLQAEATELYNIATSAALDGTAVGANGSGTGGTPAVMTNASTGTLGASGDYIYDACEVDSGVINFTWSLPTQSNITWKFVDSNTIDGMAQEGGVYASTTAFTPEMKVVNASNWTWSCVAMALKAASAGTAPSATAIRVANVQHISDCPGADSSSCVSSPQSIVYQITTYGDLLDLEYHTGASAQIITGVTDSNSNSWTQVCDVNGLQGAPYQRWWANNTATPGTLLAVTVALNANTQDGGAGAILDVVNAASPSPLDTGLGTSGCYSATTDITSASTLTWTATTSLQTSSANELVVAGGSNDYGTGSSTNAANTFIAGYPTQPTEFGHYDQNNPMATCPATLTTSCETWTWNYTVNVGEAGTPIGNLLFVASAFMQATGSGGSGSCGPLMLLHAGCLLDAKLSDHQ